MTERCVLAYSGGLDTSVAIGWLKDKYGAEVIAMAVDVGQGVDEDLLRARGEACGASEVIVVDAREEFARDFVLPALRANALYMGKYPLVSALSRPLIVRHLVRVAREKDATAVAHGCTGKGNDQVRFDVATHALDPQLEVIAPMRVGMGLSREQEIEYAKARNIEITISKESIYSIDVNLWGRSIEAGILEDPWTAPREDVYRWTVDPEAAPEPVEIVIGFEG
ncbi:MAG: argininosuccinate synthase, partial [Actinomycetota bacterium]